MDAPLEEGLTGLERSRLDRFANAFAREVIFGKFERAMAWASMAEIVVEDAGVREDA